MNILLIILAFILNSAAHLLLKVGATSGLHLQSYNPLYLVRENYVVLIGLFFFAASAACYFFVLRVLPVSVAYPTIVIASFIIINLSAYFYLRESIGAWQLLGYIFLIAGIFLIYFFRK